MLGPTAYALSALLVPLPSGPAGAHLHVSGARLHVSGAPRVPRTLLPVPHAIPLVSGAVAQTAPQDPVVVGTKNFGESYLLGEMFAQLLEARGYDVVRRPGLGASELVFQALRTRSIDVYPEYTGTGLLAILGRDPP